MKQLLFFAAIVCSISCIAQPYDAKNISLISLFAPNTSTNSGSVGNKYSGCWGWHQASKNKEYAISGGNNGTYFVDITSPATPTLCDFVPGTNSTWREMKTYDHYCYIVSDVVRPNKLQIVDLQYLPDSVHVVHNSNVLLELGHTVWIDKDKMYVGSTTFSTTNSTSAMSIWSLATPTAPVLIRRLEQDSATIGKIHEVHDMYVRNDTIYASAGWQGIRMLKLKSDNTLASIGTYDGYPSEGYNHSSWLTQNGKYLLFCDEVPESLPMNFINVQNPSNIQPVKQFKPFSQTTPHNPYIIGNDFAVVSCYQDGLFIYDISKPPAVNLAGYFDTYPQGGNNTNNYAGGAYRGNWGAYPFLPSGIIIANDMQNGIFLLDAKKAYSVGIEERKNPASLTVFPNPVKSTLHVYFNSEVPRVMTITNMLGQTVAEFSSGGDMYMQIDATSIASGTYVLTVKSDAGTAKKKIIVSH